MRVLESESFLTELSKLYIDRKESGSVWVSAKRVLKPIKREKGVSQDAEKKKTERNPRCLIRATDGRKTKISCVVSAKDQAKFLRRLLSTVNVHTEAMQKKKKLRKKSTAG